MKVLRAELAEDPEFRARFSREVAVLARVGGARIVRVIMDGAGACGPFLVTEYTAGPSLARYVESAGPLGAGKLHRLAAGLAEALAAIHAAGIVHRDLKPANVILAADGSKVIDFGIAQALDSVAPTQTGVMVGSAGDMAPEQVMGQAGPAADIFAWAVTVAYAASGQPPFGTGPTDAILYRIVHARPDIAAALALLRPVVEAALAKEPQARPTADELLAWLAFSPAVPAPDCPGDDAADTLPVPPAQPPAGLWACQPGQRVPALAGPATSGSRRPGAVRRLTSRRTAMTAVPLVAFMVTAALALALLPGRGPTAARLAGSRGGSASRALGAGTSARPFGTYPGEQGRGVLQTISRIAASGGTIVTTGAQVSDGVVRQQFFASADGGASWRLAPVRAPGGGQPPLGYAATRLAGGPKGWVAIGTAAPEAIWTSTDGLSWTLAARHGIAPQQPSDQIWVLTATAQGFLAAGQARGPGGRPQAVIWTSRDGVAWQRMTAAQAGLAGAQNISYAASAGQDTVISGTLASGAAATWLSTDGGSTWTPVTVPAGHDAGTTISGLASDGSGLIAVRPGPAGGGIAYFSPNGLTWQYAATVGAPGGFTPQVVKGGADGFVVTGTDAAGNYVAYASSGAGTTWRLTGLLGPAAGYASAPAATVAPGGTVIAAGSTRASKVSQQAVVLAASPGGAVRPVPLDGIPGATVPEVAVRSMAAAGGQQVAVGSADGYPAIWRKAPGGAWRLVSSLSLVSAEPGLTALTSVTHGVGRLARRGRARPGRLHLRGRHHLAARPRRSPPTWPAWSASPAAAGPARLRHRRQAGRARRRLRRRRVVVTRPGPRTRAHDVNDTAGSSQVLAVAADAHGFISAGSHDGQPAVWTTTDGRTWTTTVLPLPPGPAACCSR